MVKSTALIKKEYLIPFILVTGLFLFWGIPSNMNDILIKQFMKSFELNRLQAGLIQSAFYMGYFILAIPAALIMRRFGYKTGLVIGLMLFSTGAILFWPAALIGKYGMFLFALFVIASGASFLETGANPFIATLGDPDTSEKRLNFSQAFNPLGAVTGVGIGTIFIFSGVEHSQEKIAVMKAAGTYQAYLHSETLRVIAPYVVLGLVIFVWGLLILATKFPEPHADDILAKNNKGKISDLFKYPHFYKGVLAQFCYVGAQVGTWSYFILYIQDYTHVGEKLAGSFSYRHPGCFCRRALFCHLSDELFQTRETHAQLWTDEYCAGIDRYFASGLDWGLCPSVYKLFHVTYVSHHFCARN